MYILLQHFPFESKAIIKAFDELVDIENYMESKIKTKGSYDYYAGSSVGQVQLTGEPKYNPSCPS